jgi:hypothetical protein
VVTSIADCGAGLSLSKSLRIVDCGLGLVSGGFDKLNPTETPSPARLLALSLSDFLALRLSGFLISPFPPFPDGRFS